MSLACHQSDPLQDPRWMKLVTEHPKASVFHTPSWLEALQSTYQYEPVVFTTSAPNDELTNGIVFCRVRSWLTGNRLVSLPFSDHCEPLFDSPEEANELIRRLREKVEREKWRYLEIRPVNRPVLEGDDARGFAPSSTYLLHVLDLQGSLEEILGGLDKDSLQRRIHRANRAGLIEKCGRSTELLNDFYRLFVQTRGRHGLPATPYAWFANLVLFQRDALEIRAAYKDNIAIAAILTLRFRDQIYYKNGCSDARFKRLGAMPWLLWNAAVAAKAEGAVKFDLGRSEPGNAGLVRFKDHWVRPARELTYWRFPPSPALDSTDSWKFKLAKNAFSYMPGSLRRLIGKAVYRHIG